MWFAFVKSPLGASFRVTKTLVADLGEDCGDSEFVKLLGRVLEVEVVRADDLDGVYRIVSIDPDLGDMVRLGVRKYVVGTLK